MVGIQAARLGHAHDRALDQHQLHHRIELGLADRRADGPHVLRQPVPSRVAQDPHQRPRAGQADRAVAILHRRVGLRVHPGGLPCLQRRLVGQPDRPARAQEHGVVERPRVHRQRARQEASSLVGDRTDVVAQAGPQHRQDRGGEPRLDHRAFVGERQHQPVVRRPGHRAVLGGGDGQEARGAGQPFEQVDDLGGGPAAGDGHHPVVRPAGGELRGREGVRLALAGGLAQRRVRPADVQGGPAPDHRDALAGCRQEVVAGPSDLRRPVPAPGLAPDLARGFAHFPARYARNLQGSRRVRASVRYSGPCGRPNG